MSLSKISTVTERGGDLSKPHRRFAPRPDARTLHRHPGRSPGAPISSCSSTNAVGLAGAGGSRRRRPATFRPLGRAVAGRRSGNAIVNPCSAIQQGSTHPACGGSPRSRLVEIGFDGYAIGGLAVGEGHGAMCEVLDYAPGLSPPTGRVTSWASASRSISSKPWRGASTCSTACFPPGRTPWSGLDAGRFDQSEERLLRRMTRRLLTRRSTVRPAGTTRGPTCTTS